MKNVQPFIKRCCNSLAEDIETGRLEIRRTSIDVNIFYPGTEVCVMHCPHCGEVTSSVKVILNNHKEKPESSDNTDQSWDLTAQLNRGMEDFELKGLKRAYKKWLLEQGSSAPNSDRIDCLEDLIDRLSPVTGRWKFLREYGHYAFDYEDYCCHGKCNTVTAHYMIENQAICSICLEKQPRDSSVDNIEYVGNLWFENDVIGKVKVEKFNYIGSVAYRVTIEINGHVLEVGSDFTDRDSAVEFAQDYIEVQK